MKKAMYPGSFDPITNGHLDIIERASAVFDEVVVVIMQNPKKKNHFSVEERLSMIKEVVKDIKNVSVDAGEGLTVNFAKKEGAKALIRGIRAVTDYEYELQQASANMFLDSSIETIFFLARPEYSFLSSSSVVEMASNNGKITGLVPKCLETQIIERLSSK